MERFERGGVVGVAQYWRVPVDECVVQRRDDRWVCARTDAAHLARLRPCDHVNVPAMAL